MSDIDNILSAIRTAITPDSLDWSALADAMSEVGDERHGVARRIGRILRFCETKGSRTQLDEVRGMVAAVVTEADFLGELLAATRTMQANPVWDLSRFRDAVADLAKVI